MQTASRRQRRRSNSFAEPPTALERLPGFWRRSFAPAKAGTDDGQESPDSKQYAEGLPEVLRGVCGRGAGVSALGQTVLLRRIRVKPMGGECRPPGKQAKKRFPVPLKLSFNEVVLPGAATVPFTLGLRPSRFRFSVNAVDRQSCADGSEMLYERFAATPNSSA